MARLRPGDTFPDLDVDLVGGDRLHLPDDLRGGFGVVLFNRGAWCPFCTTQLRGFQRAVADLAELGARVVSLSVDDEATAAGLVRENDLTFPIGHSADATALAEATGAFVNTDPVHLQATGFVLDTAGVVVLSAFSSGAIGRLTAPDTVGLLRHLTAAHG